MVGAEPAGEAIDRPGWAAFTQRDDLVEYGSNALLLYVAQLRLGFDDVETFAADALTDDSNDKKCDLVAVMSDAQRLIVAQGYMTEKDRSEAPAGKASDLNTAVTWLLYGELSGLPLALQSAAREAREALADGQIAEMQLWYVHNLPESQNVRTELRQAARTADTLLKQQYSDLDIDVSFYEIGRAAIEEDYRQTQVPILVSDKVTFEVPGGFEMSGDSWKSYTTAIRVTSLRELWATHQSKLMSPNIRDYLGVVKSTKNINYGIKETARWEPGNFAIFNNGITVLVLNYDVRVESDKTLLDVTGVGIVNGGQTTGSLGTLEEKEIADIESAQVMARFVKSDDVEVLENIIRYNNTQNKIEAADFRSKDTVQEKLREEFKLIPDAEYKGGRRGGKTNAIARQKSLVPDSSVAQSLAAFHGDPNLAYNELRTIWENDGTYARVFRESLTAGHVVFCYSLLKAVEKAKQDIVKIPEDDRTAAQKRHAAFFSKRGSTHLLVAAHGYCIETILGTAIPDKYALHFTRSVSPAEAIGLWQPVVNSGLAFSQQLDAAVVGLKVQDRVVASFEIFSGMIEATRQANSEPFDTLASEVSISD